MPPPELKASPMRRGARRMADVSPELLARLNAGLEPSLSLAETLAIDFSALLAALTPACRGSSTRFLDPAGQRLGITQRMAIAAELLSDCLGPTPAFERCHAHPSDIVRGWACYLLARAPRLTLAARLKRLQPLADDPHSGVREWAWLALRPHVASACHTDPDAALALLLPWTTHPSPNLRRFASEITRPRGVWCAHLEIFKSEPARALPLLTPLRADPARYVQDSVANWLNDAAKSQPAFVRATCARWQKESPTPATLRICRRALRSL